MYESSLAIAYVRLPEGQPVLRGTPINSHKQAFLRKLQFLIIVGSWLVRLIILITAAHADGFIKGSSLQYTITPT